MSSYSYLRRKLAKKTLLAEFESRLPQIGAPGGNAGVGDVFFVNGSTGSNNNTGRADSPFATITYALTKCTDRNDDTILVTRDTTEAAYPVSINKRDIHIFGWDYPTRVGAEKVYFASGGAYACFEVAAQNVEIAGFDFVANASYPAIQFANAAYWNCAIHDCNFGRRGALQDGINLGGVSRDAAYITVYDNYFAGGIARDGVRFEGAGSFGWIGLPGHGNVFDVTLIGINVTVGVTLSGVYDNTFSLPSDTIGYAIYFNNASCTGAIVDGNRAHYQDSGTANPYCDKGTNTWLLNYEQGITATMPNTTGS